LPTELERLDTSIFTVPCDFPPNESETILEGKRAKSTIKGEIENYLRIENKV